MIRGFILAAGFGTRLRPLTDHLPKALVSVAGKPLLYHALNFLSSSNITTIGVNAHYQTDAIERFRKQSFADFEIFNEQPEIRGTGGALDYARRFLAGDEYFFVINADIIARFDIRTIIESFINSNDACMLIAWPNNRGNGTILYDSQSGMYQGTPSDTPDRTGFATADFIGMALYRREFLTCVKASDFSIVPVWKRAAAAGMTVSVRTVEHGYWCDTGTPEALADAHFAVIDQKLQIPLPEELRIDKQRKCCFPVEWSDSMAEHLGPYCWIEESSCKPLRGMSHTVIFKNALHDSSEEYRARTLYTPWGGIAFHG